MDKLILHDVRCFRGRLEAPLAPLTLLIGENSAGKSSFLALTRVAADVATGVRNPSFNNEPFELGSYESIAHYHGGQGKRAKEFLLGITSKHQFFLRKGKTVRQREREVTVEAVFRPEDGQPRLSKWTWLSESDRIEVSLDPASAKVQVEGTIHGTHFAHDLEAAFEIPSLTMAVRFAMQAPTRGAGAAEWDSVMDLLLLSGHNRDLHPYPVAPIRTRPERTYDPIRDQPSSSGGHIPVVLSQLRIRKNGWDEIQKELASFGKASGLFTQFDIRPLGRKGGGDPFQVELELHGQKGRRNLIDVGYGVSQVLPILVESLVQPQGTTFLLQQPEVHLHPRAQAQLGTFLARVAKKRRLQYIVETHSDFLVDRIAIAVREKQLSESDVSLLFFEQLESGEATITPMRIDSHGNVLGAPDGYRRFFLEEQAEYLG